MKLTTLSVYVSHYDASNGGITSKEREIYLVDPIHGTEINTDKIPKAAIFRHEDCGGGYIRLIPYYADSRGLCGPSCGGNIATLARFIPTIPRNHPLMGKFMHVHDRYETWELNRLLSI